ncbi:MAG: nicotinate-nucleotide adenylyltransferase [Bacteroidales bacterium]|nr:nicotinate-nucleotide adenylyltransferase [Bacteroidales bacterium]
MNPDRSPKTGLFFGSFDPVHTGHLIIAEYMSAHTDLDEIWFVISPQNPFKTEKEITGQEIRKEMLEIVVSGNSKFSICDIEFNMPAPQYTHKTLDVLREKYPEKQFVLIIGTDNLDAFDRWKNYEKIMDMIDIYVYPRPGFESRRFLSHPSMHLVKAPLVEISSTYIRESFMKRKPARYMLPEKVFDYITKKGLYRK